MALVIPEFLQTKKYSALRDRLVLQHGGVLQAGVWDVNDYKAVQRAAGANMSVDIGAGFALIQATSGGNAGFYHIQNDATVNVLVTSAHATLPRIDQAYILINDTTSGGDATDTPQLLVAPGTATAGATLDNRTGAAALPTDSLRLADILVPAASSSVVTANIRDRRPWARGVQFIDRQNSGVAYSTASTSTAALESARYGKRLEISTGWIEATLSFGNISSTGANQSIAFDLYMDSAAVQRRFFTTTTASTAYGGVVNWLLPLAAGSHVMDLQWQNAVAGTTSLLRAAFTDLTFELREILPPVLSVNS